MTEHHPTSRYDPRATPNPEFDDLSDELRKRDNASFLACVADQLSSLARRKDVGGTHFVASGVGCIGLVGGFGRAAARVRQAQSTVRVDASASWWSHAFVFGSALGLDAKTNRSAKKSPWLWECSLHENAAFELTRERHGAAPRRFADYARAAFEPGAGLGSPNIAVIAVALTDAERQALSEWVEHLGADRGRHDLVELTTVWQAAVAGRWCGNPLVSGVPHPAAAFVDAAFHAAGIDLFPGAPSGVIAPEHLWQTVRYLHDAVRVAGSEGTAPPPPRPMHAWMCVREPLGLAAPAGVEVPRRMSELTGSSD